jgi:hypothetical protein
LGWGLAFGLYGGIAKGPLFLYFGLLGALWLLWAAAADQGLRVSDQAWTLQGPGGKKGASF